MPVQRMGILNTVNHTILVGMPVEWIKDPQYQHPRDTSGYAGVVKRDGLKIR